MRVYTKIVVNIESGKVVEAEFYEYHGPVATAKGDGGGQSYDPVYNAGMLELSQEQQDWARQMFNQYQYGVAYDPNEIDEETGKPLGELRGYDPSGQTSEMQYQQNLIEANQAMLGQRSDTEGSELQYQQELAEANRSLLPQRTEVESAQLSDVLTGIGERAPVRSEFYDQALSGIDVGRRMDEAQADVEHGFKLSGESARREAMSYGGLDPSKIASISTGMNLEKAKTIAGARTGAKTTAEDEQFSRLRSAMTI